MNQNGNPHVFANTGSAVTPSYTDLRTMESGEFNNYFHQETTYNYMNQFNSQREFFFYPRNNQLDTWNDGQYLYQFANGDYAPPFGSAAPSHPYSDPTAMMFPEVMAQKPNFQTDLFEADFSTFPTLSSTFSAPAVAPLAPLAPHTPHHDQQDSRFGKSKRTKQHQKNQVYIKKPLNAFMLYMKEKRSTVKSSISVQGSGAVHAFLGSMWRSLSREEQKKYYVEADRLRMEHQQLYPDWSTKDNYGKKWAKIQKRKVAVGYDTDEESSESQVEESPPSKWMMMTPKYMAKKASKASKRKTLVTKSHLQMNLRPRQPLSYQSSP